MPKPYTFPLLLDEVKQVSISKLKDFGYLKPDSFKSGKLIWSCTGEEIGSINIFVSMRKKPFLELSYTYNQEEPVKYKINLISKPSNLGVGKIWYFICPYTGKRCRKLYSAGKYFLHRDAYPQALYSCQTYSKGVRMIDKVHKFMYVYDKLYEELYSKHFKAHYAGKPTKRYMEIVRKLEHVRQKHDQALACSLMSFTNN